MGIFLGLDCCVRYGSVGVAVTTPLLTLAAGRGFSSSQRSFRS